MAKPKKKKFTSLGADEILFRIVALPLVGAGTLFTLFFSPLYAWETTIYILAIASPALIFLFRFLCKKSLAKSADISKYLTKITDPERRASLQAQMKITGVQKSLARMQAGLATFLVGLALLAIAFTTNVYFDKSLPEKHSVRIESASRDWFGGRHSGPHYSAYFQHITPSPLPFAFSELQNVGISKKNCAEVIPGTTTLDIFIHKGFLGFPWYESKTYSFSGLRAWEEGCRNSPI